MSKVFGTALFMVLASSVQAQGLALDLLSDRSEWLLAEASEWRLDDDSLTGRTAIFDGEKTDPAASTFLESRRMFGGDKSLDVEVTFDTGRYLGVYVDYDPASDSGIWMATGHFLPEEERLHHVESAYIKTVERGHWVVRATGELDVPRGQSLSLRFERAGDVYRVWQGDRLVVTYHKPGGYPPGKIRLRLVNAAATVTRLEVTAGNIVDPRNNVSGSGGDARPSER